MSLRTGSGRSGLLELQQRRTDEADLVRLGFAPAPRSHGDVLRDYAAEAQRLDQLGERERVKRAEEQLAVRTERVAQPERQLEAEGQGHARSQRNSTAPSPAGKRNVAAPSGRVTAVGLRAFGLALMAVDRPASPAWWAVDGEIHGHSVSETEPRTTPTR
jgi:hypothetical protein